MSDYVYSNRGSLVLAEEAQDEQSIKHALKEIDRRLVLQKEVDEDRGCWRYRVLLLLGREVPAEHICYWTDEYLSPLPLSSGLLELVRKQLYRGLHETVEQHNEKLREARAQENRAEVREVVVDVVRSSKRSAMLPRSQSLRMARDRQRAEGRNV